MGRGCGGRQDSPAALQRVGGCGARGKARMIRTTPAALLIVGRCPGLGVRLNCHWIEQGDVGIGVKLRQLGPGSPAALQ
eukprot:scaffold3215_cov90-Isochrysis_galbana.AAC.5